MSSPSTMTLTPRIRVTRQSPSHYDRSSTSQIASSSRTNFSKLPEFSQLMDMDMDVDMEGTDAFTERDTASEKSTATTTKTPQPPSNPAATLRALLAKLPTTSSSPAQSPSQYPYERESDYDMSVATRGAPSAQESVRSIFSKVLGDSDETPTRPLQRQDTLDNRENEATPMPGRARGVHRSFKGSDSGDSSQQPSRASSRFKGSSQPITQEFMRERFKEAEMSETEFLPSPMSSREFSMKSSEMLEDLSASQAPIATSTPQHSLSLSVGSHFQSNLLDNNAEMRYALDHSDSQDDLFSEADIPNEKSDSRFATDISNISQNRPSSRQGGEGHSSSWKQLPPTSPAHTVNDISETHLKRNLSMASGNVLFPGTSHHSGVASQHARRHMNAERMAKRSSTVSHDSHSRFDMEVATDVVPGNSSADFPDDVPMQSTSRSASFVREPVNRSTTRTPSPLPIPSADDTGANISRRSNVSTSHITHPITNRPPSSPQSHDHETEERSSRTGRMSNFSATPRRSRSTEHSKGESPSTPVVRERRHNDSSAWTASMSIDTWQQSPYHQQSSPHFPQQILQEEVDQRYSTDEVHDDDVPIMTTPMKMERHNSASNSGRHEPEIRSPSPSKVPALPSPESSPQSASKAPWIYNRARHPITPGFATPKPPGGWFATPKQPWYRESDEGSAHQEADNAAHQLEQSAFTKTPRPPGGWMATPMPMAIPIPYSGSHELGINDSDIPPHHAAGLLTPIPSLSKLPALNFKTPAPPGAWAQTPAARKSILKVRFDADSSSNPLGEGPSHRRPLQPSDAVSDIHSSPSRNRPKSPKIRVLDAFGREADDDDCKVEVPEETHSKIRVVDEMGEEVETKPDNADVSSVSRVSSLSHLRQGLNELMEEIDDFDDDSDTSVNHGRVKTLIETSAAARQNAAQIQASMKTGQRHKIFVNNGVTAWWYWPLVCVAQIIFGTVIFFFCLRLTRTMFLENYWEPFNPELHLQAFDNHDFMQANRTIWFSSRTLEWLDWSNYLIKPKHYLWNLWEFAGGQQPGKLWPLT